jgi:hypothetical protein
MTDSLSRILALGFVLPTVTEISLRPFAPPVQMMRYHTFKILSTVGGGFDVTEEDLVAWANAKVRPLC